MVNLKSRKTGDFLLLANGVVLVVLLNIISSKFFYRFDLTQEKRYSIKSQTKEILKSVDEDVFIEVYLEGDLNAQFRRFQKSIRETLEEFRIYSDNRVKYEFVNPSTAISQKARSEFMQELATKGIQPTNVIDKQDGQRVEKLIFPGAVIAYGGAEKGVMLLKGNKARTPEEEINQSIEGVEFEFANAIYQLVNVDRKTIGLVHGHGELDSLAASGFVDALLDVYDVTDIDLSKNALSNIDALVIAKPTRPYSPIEKFALDQYIMKGGKVLFLIDRLGASMDSASRDDYYAFPYDMGLDDQLFRYGVRLNIDLVQDRSAALYPIITGQVGNKPQIQLLDWPFFPLINRFAEHPITRNLDAVVTRFASSIDTVKASGVRKTPLMFSSSYSRRLTAPVNVSVNDIRKNVKPETFNSGNLPIAYLLEGSFSSLYKNRFLPAGADSADFRQDGEATRLIVVSDGDLARNEINPRTGQPQPLGFDPFTNYTFANRDLLMNMLAYLTDDNGLINARNKEIKIRPLDKQKVSDEKVMWQVINLVLPLVLLIAFGIIRSWSRKRKYARFNS